MERCWASRYCKQCDKPGCNEFCSGYVILEILYKQSNIPKRYQYPQVLVDEGPDKHIYDYVVKLVSGDIVSWVGAGNNLMFWGENRGNGKTSLACVIANKYIREMVTQTNLEPAVYFIKSAKFLEDIRKQYNNPTPEFPLILKQIETVPLLILDDIGAERPTEWVRERLLTIIDERYSNSLSTIYTSNCSLIEINDSLKGRIADRLRDAVSFNFQGSTRRGNN